MNLIGGHWNDQSWVWIWRVFLFIFFIEGVWYQAPTCFSIIALREDFPGMRVYSPVLKGNGTDFFNITLSICPSDNIGILYCWEFVL